MNPTGGNTTQMNPDDVQTAIDSVAVEKYNTDGQPDILSVKDEKFFKQESFEGKSHIWDEFSGVPNTEEHQEQEYVKTVDVELGNQKVQSVKFFKNDYPISLEAFRTGKGHIRDRMGESIATAVKRKQQYVGIIDALGDAFDGNNFTTPDGEAAASNSHLTLRGDTVDNLETAAMAPDAFDTLLQSLESQIGQHGDWGGNVASAVAVPRNIYKHTKEVLNSTLIADSAENNLNIFDTDYGQLTIKQSPLLSSKFNSGSNANTGYHLFSENTNLVRRTLFDMELTMIEPQYTGTDSYVERVRFAEVSYWETHFGYAASTGAA